MASYITLWFMLKTYLYIPDELEDKIVRTARHHKKSKAEVMRRALEKGVTEVYGQSDASVQVLFKLAELGKRFKFKGPKNSSERIDELLWSKDWSK